MKIQGKLMLSVLVGVLVIVSGCGSGSTDNSNKTVGSGNTNSTGVSNSIDNTGGSGNSSSSNKHFTLYGIKLGDSDDEIIKTLADAGIAKPDTKLIESLNVKPLAYRDLGDTFGLFVKDKEVIKTLQGLVRPVFKKAFLVKPWGIVYFCYFDKASSIPFAIYMYVDSESMKKEDDPFRNNRFYHEICEQSGQPDSKQDNDGDIKIQEAKFQAKWETQDEELVFSIICERDVLCKARYPEEYNYEVRLFNLAAMRPYIERAEDIIKAYNENNN